MESVRVQLSGKRIRANGRIVAAATANNPAFGAHYDLQTDETGATKRFGLTVTLAERERQLAIARDEENMWLVTDHQGERRAAYNGALDIDLVFSPFFNALPIRRLGLHERAESIALPVVYVNVPEMSVDAATVSYTSEGRLDGIKLRSPVADTTVTGGPVSDGFVTVEGLPPVVMHHSHESQFGRPSRRSRARWLFVVHLVIASRRCSAASSPRTPAVRRSAYTLGHNIDLNPCRFCSVSRAHAGVGKKRNINRPPAISCNPAAIAARRRSLHDRPGT